jgi:hypothetical protein
MTKPTRRSFIAKTSLLALSATTSSGWAASPAKSMLTHHVFFWLKNPSSKEDLAKLIEGIRTLEKIETPKEFKLGTPANTTKRDVIDDSYAISLFTRFNDIAGHDVYQEHPIHKKFIEIYSPLWSKVQVYDSMDI